MTGKHDKTSAQKLALPCAARIVSEQAAELSLQYGLSLSSIPAQLPLAEHPKLSVDCSSCHGTAEFSGSVVVDRCLVVRDGTEPCEQSSISLHPQDYLDENGALRTTEVRCGAASGSIVCSALFRLSRSNKDGALTAETEEGMCIVDYSDLRFRQSRWKPLQAAPLEVGYMHLPEDENGEAIMPDSGAIVAPEQQDAESIGQDPLRGYWPEILGSEPADSSPQE